MNTTNLTPDLEATCAFLATLDPTPGARFGFACFDDHGDDYRLAMRLYGDLDQATRLTGTKKGQLCSTVGMLAFMQSLGAGVFITVQQLDGAGAGARNVDCIRAAIADADDDAQLESLHRFIARSGLEPSIVVASGGVTAGGPAKQQAYWKLSDCPLDRFASIQAMVISRAGTDPAVKDLARVLRLPGFFHQKREPRITRIVAITNRIYDSREFVRRVEAQPQVCDPGPDSAAGVNGSYGSHGSRRIGGIQHGQARQDAQDAQDAQDGRTARLRALLDHYGGLITPSVHALLREAQAPGEGTAGNRHATLVAVAAKLAQARWDDDNIRQLVLPVVNAEWGDGDWSDHLARITAWVRAREAETLAAAHTTTWPGQSRAANTAHERGEARPSPSDAGGPA